MNKVKMQKYVEAALLLLEDHSLTAGGQVDKATVGKFASFGPTVFDMGLKPAVMLYSNETSVGEGDRRPVVNAIYDVMKQCHPEPLRQYRNLLEYVRPLQGETLFNAKEEILDICVTLKLALRTFPTKPEKTKNTENTEP